MDKLLNEQCRDCIFFSLCHNAKLEYCEGESYFSKDHFAPVEEDNDESI